MRLSWKVWSERNIGFVLYFSKLGMADSIELFLVGQGLLLISFIAMVVLFLLLLLVRNHFGPGRLAGAEGQY